jgi:mono/diheme cytochrome c family protein
VKHLFAALPLALGIVSAAGAAEPVTFSKDIVPILKTRCVMCHLTGQEPGNMKLAPKVAYATLVGVKATETDLKRIEPGKPDQSYVVRKLEGTHVAAGGTGEQMPMGGDPLPPEQIQKIRAWIEQGAQNN